MKYRGFEFKSDVLPFDLVAGDIVGCDPDQGHQRYVKHLPESNPEFQLRYRSVNHADSADATGIISSTLPAELYPAPIVSTIVPLRRSVDTHMAAVHHLNLNRKLEQRLEAARSQGNIQLVQMLEAERELI